MKYLKTFEEKTYNPVVYMSGDVNREFFLTITDNNVVKGGMLCGRPNSGEKDFFSVTKVAVTEFKKGYGKMLYETALALLGDRGISPHRKVDSTRAPAQELWKRLNDKAYVKRIDLETKLYNNKPLLDSKYILTDKNMKKDILSNLKTISNDSHDETFDINKRAWEIINAAMN